MKINLTQVTNRVLLNDIPYGKYFWFNDQLYVLLNRDTTESPEEGVFVFCVPTNSLRTLSIQTQVYCENRSLVLNLEK